MRLYFDISTMRLCLFSIHIIPILHTQSFRRHGAALINKNIQLNMDSFREESAFNKNAAFEINGHHTEILLHKFQNRFLLFITQYGKLNNIFSVSNDVAVSGFAQEDSFNITHKFGMTSDEIECSIKYLMNNIRLAGFDNRMEVVFCLGLKEYNGKILRAITEAVNMLV